MRYSTFTKLFGCLFLMLILVTDASLFSHAATKLTSLDKAHNFLKSSIKGVGLVDSYVDSSAASYTYDNALAVMAFTTRDDYANARKILSNYQNILEPLGAGGYYDVYNYVTGAGSGTISAGPNSWLLNAVNLYYYKTGDAQFLALAQRLADFLAGLQDVDGGLFGDDYVSWKSTEHNISSYAALYNFGIFTNQELYVQKALSIKDFIINECWNGERFLRGENDPTEVTDVQPLGVLALGTSYASSIYWAEYHTKCTKKLGRLSVTGFDFNDDLDTVWLEGTLQEASAFRKNYDDYRAGIYYNNVNKTQRTSGGFLCATNQGTTGTDWVLYPIECVAPTCWYIFYNTNTNPLLR